MHVEINQTITSKYKEVVQAVRDYMKLGADKAAAVEAAINDHWHKFQSLEDMDLLRSWFNGAFKNAA